MPGWGLAALLLARLAAPAAADEHAGRTIDLTLENAVRLALENSRTLKDARLGRAEQKDALAAARERYHPRAGIDLSLQTDGRGDETGDVAVGPSLRIPTGGTFSLNWSRPIAGEGGRSGRYSFGFSQPLLKGFGSEVETAPLRKALIREQVNRRSFRDTAAGVIASVVGAYRRVIRANRQIEISRQALARARKQIEINRVLIRAGRMAAREIVETEAEVANRELALIDSENGLESANAALIDILDLEGAARIRPTEKLDIEPVRPDLERSVETALARRLDHLRARLNVQQARVDVRVADNDRLWDLVLNVGVSDAAAGGETDYRAGLNLAVPLWDPSPRRGLAHARNDLKRAEMALAEVRQTIRIEVRQAVHGVNVGLRSIELARRARELAEQKLDVEQKKLQQGLTSTFRLASVERDLVGAQNRELDAVLNYLGALTALDRTLGTTLESWGIEVEKAE